MCRPHCRADTRVRPYEIEIQPVSEQESRAQLDFTRRESRAADAAEVCVAESIVRIREVCPVEQIERLHPELDRTGPAECCPFEQREVGVDEVGSAHLADLVVPELVV